jgi:hypothetical protein
MHPAPDRLTQQSRLDRVGEPHPDRDGQARTRRAGATPALRAFSYWELIHIGIKKLGRIERGAGARVVGMANRGSGLRGETPPGGPPDRRLGVVHIDIDDCSRLACRGSVKIARHPPWSRSSGEWSTSTPGMESPSRRCRPTFKLLVLLGDSCDRLSHATHPPAAVPADRWIPPRPAGIAWVEPVAAASRHPYSPRQHRPTVQGAPLLALRRSL